MTINKITFFIALLITTISKSQTFEDNYLGEDYLQYKGVLFKLKSDAISGFSHTFYSDLKYCKSAYDNNVIYPEQKYFFNTVKDSLMNRIFIVENIVDKSGASLTNSDLTIETPIFVLKDTTTKQMIYYKYDKKYEHNFQFNTSKIVLDEKSICTKLERQVDDFTGAIKINSPISSNYDIEPMIIYKDITKTKTSYFLSLSSYGSTVSTNGTGATILFTDGTKWTKPVKIDVEVDKDGYEYSAFITLTAADLTTFMTKKIKKYRLYIYDNIINPINADKFKIYVKCIKDSK
jgi:hypothetical protein